MQGTLSGSPAGVEEADAVVLLVDGQAGLQPGDRDILAWLRQVSCASASQTESCFLAAWHNNGQVLGRPRQVAARDTARNPTLAPVCLQNHPSKPITLGVNKCDNQAKADLMVGCAVGTAFHMHRCIKPCN